MSIESVACFEIAAELRLEEITEEKVIAVSVQLGLLRTCTTGVRSLVVCTSPAAGGVIAAMIDAR